MNGLWLNIIFAHYKSSKKVKTKGIYISTVKTMKQNPKPGNMERTDEIIPLESVQRKKSTTLNTLNHTAQGQNIKSINIGQ